LEGYCSGSEWKIRHVFMTTLVLFLVLQNSELPFNKPFSCLWNSIRFTWHVPHPTVILTNSRARECHVM
jgi:hypothetical protein